MCFQVSLKRIFAITTSIILVLLLFITPNLPIDYHDYFFLLNPLNFDLVSRTIADNKRDVTMNATISYSSQQKSVVSESYIRQDFQKEFIYIYEWPEILDTLRNKSQHYWREYPIDYRDNDGMGPIRNTLDGQFTTWQFALYDIMMGRLKNDYRRTWDPSIATTFVIPYNYHLDAFIKPENGKMRMADCPIAASVTKRLYESPFFNRSHGNNHLLIVSGNQNLDYFYTSKKCKPFLAEICHNCTKLAIDDYTLLENKGSFRNFIEQKGRHWHAVPFPSNSHYIPNVPSSQSWRVNASDKTIIVSYIGSLQSSNHVSRKIRNYLNTCCTQKNYSLPINDVHSGRTFIPCEFHVLKNRVVYDAYSLQQVARKSIFCLQVHPPHPPHPLLPSLRTYAYI